MRRKKTRRDVHFPNIDENPDFYLVWESEPQFADYLRALAGVLGLEPEAGVRRLETLRAEIAAEARAARGERGAPLVFVEATARELHTCAPDSWPSLLGLERGGRALIHIFYGE